jgi:tRNA A-37 threonylcarbamoyl transferase component Bud32
VAELHSRGLRHGAITVDSVLLTDKGKAKLRLIDATGSGNDAADVVALRRVLSSIAAGPVPSIQTDSAAVLAAALRS